MVRCLFNMRIVTRLFAAIGALAGSAVVWQLLQPEFVQRRPSRFLASAARDRNGQRPVALITGASAGIGAAFARRLALAGYDLTLVGRRSDRLLALADSLQRQHGIEARALPADLSDEDDIERVAGVTYEVSEAGQLDLLINNAGFGTVGKYADLPFQSHLDMLQVHVTATMRLTTAGLPGMLRRRRGGVINVASTASWYPLPGNATYSATKRYLVNFSESLQAELEGSGVYVQALCPGFTYSEFHDREPYRASGFRRERLPAFAWQTAEAVVEASLNALGHGTVCIPGAHNRAIVLIGNIAPRALVNAIWRRVSPI